MVYLSVQTKLMQADVSNLSDMDLELGEISQAQSDGYSQHIGRRDHTRICKIVLS
jgi:hypothetical protein